MRHAPFQYSDILWYYRMHPLENIRTIECSQNSNGTKIQEYEKQLCLWPLIDLSNNVQIHRYEEYFCKLSNNHEKKPYRRMPWLEDAGVFSSPLNRNIVERVFLEKGIEIVEKCKATSGMYPLGYNLWPSFGFGSFTANYMNIPNTSPLVLWWGNLIRKGDTLDTWYPLLPRRINANETLETDSEAASFEASCNKDIRYKMPPTVKKFISG